MHFVKFYPEVASCLLSRGKRMHVPLGMRLLWKYIRNFFLVYHLISHILLYLQNYKEFEAEILDLPLEKYGLSFDIKKCTTSGWALGDENVIGIRSFKRIWCYTRTQSFQMTQGGYQVKIILTDKKQNSCCSDQCFLRLLGDFCTELSLHRSVIQSPRFTNDYKFGISVNTYQ